MEYTIIVILAIILVGIIAILIKKPHPSNLLEVDQLRLENQSLKINLAKLEERAENYLQEKEKNSQLFKEEKEFLVKELIEEREKVNTVTRSLESSKAWMQAQKEKITEQALEMEKNQQKFNADFELIATKILDEKTKKFTDQNQVNLTTLLTPLKENIKSFEEKVEKVYKTESDERNNLKGVISQLMDLNKLMSTETQNLTKALKGDNKKQGNWGEMILERVLERSGLVKDQEYRIQNSFQSTDGSRFQPDVIIDLPDDKHLIIDAKVSLLAYERLVNCETDDDHDVFTKQHVLSVRNHVNGLAAKNYSDLYKINSPDFVLLFIPIESCLSIAVQKDAELFNFAWEKRVVIVSPSTLLATLRTIASIWKQERQNKNVLEIARLSGEMYDKFVGFITDMESIGKNIKQSHDAYEKALNKLTEGRGNLTTTAEKVKKLGAKASKQIDTKFLSEVEGLSL
ncbi:MAG: rmuC [Sphingobacteriales bacterium]|nr:rmuC [Sphingobacteriales bacterium]